MNLFTGRRQLLDSHTAKAVTEMKRSGIEVSMAKGEAKAVTEMKRRRIEVSMAKAVTEACKVGIQKL